MDSNPDPNESDTPTDTYESESDYSTPPFSPLSSDNESVSPESDSDVGSDVGDDAGESDESNSSAGATATTAVAAGSTSTSATMTMPESAIIPSYKLCGDNIDKTVRQRYMRVDSQGTLSLHYFHFYGVLDRVNLDHLSPLPPLDVSVDPKEAVGLLLPSLHDDKNLHENFITLISRILVNDVDLFKFGFSDVVNWHIPHKYSKEMSQKSKVVRLG